MKRIQTTIPELDEIINGGFPAASINILTGSPGTGKTILAQQIVYGNASADNKAMYLTTVNEPMHKVLRYVQDFPFFDEEKVGSSVLYEDIGAAFEAGDVDDIMKRIEELVMREAPSVLVIDSFKALSDFADDTTSFRRALFRLTGLLTASGCTTFLLGEYDTSEVGVLPEFAVADGIVELTNERRGIRTYRHLSVVKMRGSGYVEGQHAVRITPDGVKVFPRFTTPHDPMAYVPSLERVSTGVPDLDVMLEGGLREGSNTLIGGTTGLGKTLLGLTFTLSQAQEGVPVILASFQEDPNQLAHLATKLGGDLSKEAASGHLRLVYVSPVELDPDEHVQRIVKGIEEIGAKSIVIDSLSDLEEGAYNHERFLNFVYSLIQYLRDRGITSIMTYDLPESTAVSGGLGLSRLADNLILLQEERNGEQVVRTLRIVKTRGSGHDHDIRTLRLTDDGIVLEAPSRRTK